MTGVNPNQSIMRDQSRPSQAPVQQHPFSLQPFISVPADPNMTGSPQVSMQELPYQHRFLTESLQSHSSSHGFTQVLQSGQPCDNLLGVLLDPKSPASTLRISHLSPHTAPAYMQQTFFGCIQQLSGSISVWNIRCYWPCCVQNLSQSMKWQTWCRAFLMTQ